MFNAAENGSIPRKVIPAAILALVTVPLSILILGWSFSATPGSLRLVEQVVGSIFLIAGIIGIMGFIVGWMTIARYRKWAEQFPGSIILQVRTSSTIDYYLSNVARNSGGRVTTNAQLGPAGMVIDTAGIRIWAGRPSNRLVLSIDRDQVISVTSAKVAASAGGAKRFPGISIAFRVGTKDSELELPIDNLSDRRSRLLNDSDLETVMAMITARLIPRT